MSPDPIAIPAIGVALAGLILRGQHGLGARMDARAAEMTEVRDRLSRLEGKMDFLAGFFVRRNEPEPAAE